MYMRLCPDGAEGASYSMLTTFGNVALVCGSNLGKGIGVGIRCNASKGSCCIISSR